MESFSFSTQNEHHHSYCHHPQPTLLAPGFPSSSNLAAAMAYQSSTTSFPPLVLQLQGSFHPSEAAAVGGDKRRRMISTERSSTSSSLGSAQEMDGCGGNMSRKNKRGNAIADMSVTEKRAREHVDDVKAKEACGDPPAAGYIHVRAKRGQATNKHSMSERVRREKISEKMKMLESLVPGCDKVTGKALMLDEIICYVQSLQNQVEFLSMQLASLDPTMVHELFGLDFDMYPDTASQLLKMAETMPHELVQCMGQPTGSGAVAQTSPAEEAQGLTGFDQDWGSSRLMQKELNSMNMCFLQ